MENRYDAVIIGGGPAGSLAGVLLQRLGYRTCILERSGFPRHKVCGGMLTRKTTDLISSVFPDSDPGEYCDFNVRRISFFYRDKKVTTITTRDSLYQTNRLRFDGFLISRYKACGGTVMEETPFSPAMRKAPFQLSVDGNILGYKVLLGADGSLSQVRKLIDPACKPDTFCLDAEYPATMISSNPEEVEIILGYVRSGYGWKFPKSNAYNIGIGGEMKKNKDILTAFREFTRSNYQIEPSPVPPKGGFLFTGRYVKKPYLDDEILLLGDAAGLTEPVTGEGIYFALRSAQIAVESIHDYFTRRTLRLGTDYRKRLHSIHRFFRQALFMQRIFFIPPVTRLFMRHIRRRNRIAAFYADHTLSVIGLDYFRILPAYIRSKLKTIKKKHNIQ